MSTEKIVEHTCDRCGIKEKEDSYDLPEFWIALKQIDTVIRYDLCTKCSKDFKRFIKPVKSKQGMEIL